MLSLFSFRTRAVVQLVTLFLVARHCGFPQTSDPSVLIRQGEFTRATAAITAILASDSLLKPTQRLEWQFELDRMQRIRRDFTKSQDDVLTFIRRWMPEATETDLRRWEQSKALEVMMIDGQKKYFNSAARSVFRIDPQGRAIWREKHASDPPPKGLESESALNRHLGTIMKGKAQKHGLVGKAVHLHIRHAIDVPPGVVPAGEIIRCWIPFPREIPGRQYGITVIAAAPALPLIAGNDRLQRTAYFEAQASGIDTTHFEVTYEYTSRGIFAPVNASRVTRGPLKKELSPYLQEQPPHIVFTSELRGLSKRIIAEETNPYLKARRLFAWVDTSITWASAREYSTVPNLSMYAYENRHGDCGMQTMLFITLCRMNGIPARWQSGWEFRPPGDSMHDWGMIYFAPYGWVPMDVTYGLRSSKDESLRWFYLNGMDSYRLIFNDDYGTALYPAKVFPRSETVDSQRGEVEWRGGNVYFGDWDWTLEWKEQ
jgi:transglutaminase-like putative cysteine protease